MLAACASAPSRDQAGRGAFGGPPFVAPLEGTLTSGFSPGTSTHRKHDGIDLGKAQGAPVLAAADGRILRTGTWGDYGLIVMIDHGRGWQSMYAHLSRIHVREGEAIRAGEMLGQVGATGNATGPHLHFEIKRDGRHLDPAPFIGLLGSGS